jgi:hypothetical protein
MTYRCTFRDPNSGRTIASETADSANGSDAVAQNDALASAQSKGDWDEWDELVVDCNKV